MKELITSFVGLDVHVDSIAVGVAPPGRQEPHFVGTVAPQWSTLSKALGPLNKPEALQIVYEAGPCGYALARQGPSLGSHFSPARYTPLRHTTTHNRAGARLTRCSSTDEGNSRSGYVGIRAMIPDIRARQPRDGPIKCGIQSADMSVMSAAS